MVNSEILTHERVRSDLSETLALKTSVDSQSKHGICRLKINAERFENDPFLVWSLYENHIYKKFLQVNNDEKR